MSTLNIDWRERNLYDSSGHTGNIYYIRIIRRVDGYVWDPSSNKEMVSVNDITWEESTTILIEDGDTGVFPIIIPREIPAGTYDIVVYKQEGSSPQNTDDVERQFETKLGGDIFGF